MMEQQQQQGSKNVSQQSCIYSYNFDLIFCLAKMDKNHQ